MYIIKNASPHWNCLDFHQHNEVMLENSNRISKWQIDPTIDWTNNQGQVLLENETVSESLKSADYKPSKFNIYKKYDNGESVLLNFASEAAVVLDSQETEAYDCLIKKAFDKGNLKLLQNLIHMGYFVFKDENENFKFDAIRAQSAYSTGKEMDITILPTQDCNARCFYCFAHDQDRDKMTMETAEQVVRYISTVINEGTEVVFRWFGGEPLMAVDIIDYIIVNLNKAMNGKMNYCSVITTNGSFIDEKVIDKAKNIWKVRKFHLTLDGLRDEHNMRKNYYDGTFDGFQKTLDNIKKLLDSGFHVVCRLNLDNRNLHQFTKILDLLEPFKTNEKFLYMQPPCIYLKTAGMKTT